MKRVGIIFGSTTGNTAKVASMIAERLGSQAIVHDIIDKELDGLDDYDICLFGIPTWDFGELQEDWADIWESVKVLALPGKPCALFGLGDQIGYGEWFLDAMGLLHAELSRAGANIAGYWPIDGYDFEASKALTQDGSHFVGLALDEDSQSSETEARIDQWLDQLKRDFEMS